MIVIEIKGKNRIPGLLNYIRGVEKAKVQVGIFGNAVDAYKAFIAEVGKVPSSAADGPKIPPRPFMSRTGRRLENDSAQFKMTMRQLLKNGDMFSVFKAVGAHAVTAMKQEITFAPMWAEPLAEYTVEKKGHDSPLIETYAMRENINFRIENASGLHANVIPAVHTRKIIIKHSLAPMSPSFKKLFDDFNATGVKAFTIPGTKFVPTTLGKDTAWSRVTHNALKEANARNKNKGKGWSGIINPNRPLGRTHGKIGDLDVFRIKGAPIVQRAPAVPGVVIKSVVNGVTHGKVKR